MIAPPNKPIGPKPFLGQSAGLRSDDGDPFGQSLGNPSSLGAVPGPLSPLSQGAGLKFERTKTTMTALRSPPGSEQPKAALLGKGTDTPAGSEKTEAAKREFEHRPVTSHARNSAVTTEVTRTFSDPPESVLLEMARRGHFENVVRSERTKTTVEIDAEDIIAVWAGIVALLFGIGMLIGWIPINALTISVVSFSAVTPVIAQVVKARKSRTKRK
jgi:hypothetical protein